MLKKLWIGLIFLTLPLQFNIANAKEVGYNQTGTASWYGKQHHGKKTANGERFNMYGFTAAHRTLPLGCMIRVTNKDNGKSVVVKVNDRGPFVGNRMLDLSYASAKALGFVDDGTAKVNIEVLSLIHI